MILPGGHDPDGQKSRSNYKYYDTILQYDNAYDSWEVVGHTIEPKNLHAVMVMDSEDFSDYCNLTTTAVPTTFPPTTTVLSTTTIPPTTTIPQTTSLSPTTSMPSTTNMPPTTTSKSNTGEIELTITIVKLISIIVSSLLCGRGCADGSLCLVNCLVKARELFQTKMLDQFNSAPLCKCDV